MEDLLVQIAILESLILKGNENLTAIEKAVNTEESPK